MPAILLYNFEAAIFRSVGDTKVPLQALIVSGILNVLMNLFFVAVLHMTVEGVATATVLANVFSAVILLRRLMRSDLDIRVEPRALRIHTDCMGRILRIGLPAGIQSAVFSVSNIVIQAAINSLGTVVMAGSSAAFNLELMAYFVLNSFSQACTTFVGQNYGAWKLDRCKKTLALSLLEDAIATAAAVPRQLVILNKTDLPAGVEPAALSQRFGQVYPLSAATGEGVDALCRAVEALYPAGKQAQGELLTNARQADAVARSLEAVRSARRALENGMTPDAVLTDAEAALEALGELNGKRIREDLVQTIFSRFCVGK